jgi:hypothetical protein
MLRVEKVAAYGWPNCYRLANPTLDLIVTTDVGPRMLCCGFPGGQNFLAEFPATHGRCGKAQFVQDGGHTAIPT